MHKGTKVRVYISPKDECYPILKKYNGECMTISKKVGYGTVAYYELDNAISDMGIPYAFSAEYLIEMDENYEQDV